MVAVFKKIYTTCGSYGRTSLYPATTWVRVSPRHSPMALETDNR